MQPHRSQLQKVIEILSNTHAGVIALPENPSQDALAAATAMYLGLNHAGKNVTLACQTPVESTLFASDKIVQSLSTSGNDLVISFPYVEGNVDKVDWEINNGKFNIIVSPRPGSGKINSSEVKYSYAGGKVDFIITFDAPTLRTLGDLYAQNQDVFKNAKIIVIDRHVSNTFYGAANMVNRTVSSLSELTLGILHAMNIQIDKSMSTNLYHGILAATSNYTTPSVNAGTFEASAYLLKQGAQKSDDRDQASMDQPLQSVRSKKPASPFGAPSRITTQQQNPVTQKSFERPGSVKPMNAIERDINHYEGTDYTDQGEEDEWLKPNIFGSSTEDVE